jgi:hypothetical protein
VPDLEISKLPELAESQLQPTDPLAIADLSASETKKITAKNLVQAGLDLIDNGSIHGDKIESNTIGSAQLEPDSVTDIELADDAVDTGAIQDGAVTQAKLAADSVGADQIIDGSVGTDELADDAVTNDKLAPDSVGSENIADNAVGNEHLQDNSVDTAELVDGSVTENKLAAGAVTHDKLGPDAVESDNIADDAIGNEHLQDNSVDTAQLVDGAVTHDKLGADAVESDNIADGAVGTEHLQDDSVSTAKLQNGSVTAEKLADDAIGTDEIIDGSITPEKLAAVTDRGLDQSTGNIGITNDTGAASTTTSGITYNQQGLITDSVPLTAADLPVPTNSTIGAIKPGTGLEVDGDGTLNHSNSITAGSIGGVTYDSEGHITGVPAGGTLNPSALPIAGTTADAIGAVYVPVDGNVGIEVNPTTGLLRHETSPVIPGIYPRVSVDANGHIIEGFDQITADQVPGLDASIIISGQFGTNRIENNSITAPKLADYSTCLMQEDFPGPGDFLGQFWYTPSTAQLRVYARGSGPENIWLPVGFGLLQQQNLRFCFTFDATTSTIVTITQYGAPLSLAPGDPIPTATDTLAGAYGICVNGGTGITLHDIPNGTNFTNGDWIVCAGETAGWIFVDVAQGGGSGGNAQVLNDLLDVTIGGLNPVDINLGPDIAPAVALQDGDILRYYSSIGQWVNAPERTVVPTTPTPPAGAGNGSLWWDSDSGRLFVSYDDGDTTQWVPATPETGGNTGGGGGGGNGADLLNDLGDVSAVKTDQAFLQYNDLNDRWESTTTIDGGTF